MSVSLMCTPRLHSGIGDIKKVEDETKAEYDKVIAVTQTGVFFGHKACAKALKASRNASVVNISSIFGGCVNMRAS